MANEPEKLTIAVGDESVSAFVYLAGPKKRLGSTFLFAHGAGANQESGFMQLFAAGLAERGMDVMTFNFLYMEKKRSAPDPKAKLENYFRAAIDTALAHKKLKQNRLFIGGKSMGGRIGSQLVAAACEADDPIAAQIAGLVFLGYPLHPPGNPSKLRVEHLPSIKMPMLFIQGTRDSLGTPAEIEPHIKKLSARIHAIEGGDHSFKAPKKFGPSQDEIYDRAMDEIITWSKSF
jgi:predicted alpha/beta-hydrolase family hydrolase